MTAEKIAEGQAFLEDNDDCEFSEKDMRADGMDYTMTCKSPDGGSVTMNASMKFDGDSMTGTIDGDIDRGLNGRMVTGHVDRGRRCTGGHECDDEA